MTMAKGPQPAGEEFLQDIQEPEEESRVFATAPELIYHRDSIAPIWVTEFRLWFVNRRDFYLQNPYATAADYDRGGYNRVKYLLNEEHIVRHLCGFHTAGFYSIDPESNSCKWFCLDVDYDDAEEDLKKIEQAMRDEGLSPAYESSRRGGHLWLFCDEPIPARTGRIFLYNLLDELGFPIRGVRGNKEGVEVFPKQESLENGQFGNGMRAPLGIHRKVKKRYWFRDVEPNLKAQFAYLRTLPRLKRDRLENLTVGMTMPDDLLPKPIQTPVPIGQVSIFEKFDIRRYTPPARKVNRGKGDYFTQCPSCAAAGRDKSGDNLHITPKGAGPPVFTCFSGCEFRDITEACYRRFGRPEGKRDRKY